MAPFLLTLLPASAVPYDSLHTPSLALSLHSYQGQMYGIHWAKGHISPERLHLGSAKDIVEGADKHAIH